MTAAHSQVPYDEFLVMENGSDDRHEWVDGVVYAMSRGTPEHGRLTGRVIARMLNPLLDEGCEIFSSDTAIFIEAARHHTYADASVVCGSLVTRTVHDKNGQSIGEAVVNPTLIVEVLADATERYDRDGKLEAYKKLSSLEEYVLVSQSQRRIEVRSLQAGVWAGVCRRGRRKHPGPRSGDRGRHALRLSGGLGDEERRTKSRSSNACTMSTALRRGQPSHGIPRYFTSARRSPFESVTPRLIDDAPTMP